MYFDINDETSYILFFLWYRKKAIDELEEMDKEFYLFYVLALMKELDPIEECQKHCKMNPIEIKQKLLYIEKQIQLKELQVLIK